MPWTMQLRKATVVERPSVLAADLTDLLKRSGDVSPPKQRTSPIAYGRRHRPLSRRDKQGYLKPTPLGHGRAGVRSALLVQLPQAWDLGTVRLRRPTTKRKLCTVHTQSRKRDPTHEH